MSITVMETMGEPNNLGTRAEETDNKNNYEDVFFHAIQREHAQCGEAFLHVNRMFLAQK